MAPRSSILSLDISNLSSSAEFRPFPMHGKLVHSSGRILSTDDLQVPGLSPAEKCSVNSKKLRGWIRFKFLCGGFLEPARNALKLSKKPGFSIATIRDDSLTGVELQSKLIPAGQSAPTHDKARSAGSLIRPQRQSPSKIAKPWNKNHHQRVHHVVPGGEGTGNKMLITVNFVGSPGPLRFLVHWHDTVKHVIELALKAYALQGRVPAFGSDYKAVELCCANNDFQPLELHEAIGSIGTRTFILHMKKQEGESNSRGTNDSNSSPSKWSRILKGTFACRDWLL